MVQLIMLYLNHLVMYSSYFFKTPFIYEISIVALANRGYSSLLPWLTLAFPFIKSDMEFPMFSNSSFPRTGFYMIQLSMLTYDKNRQNA